MAESVSFSPGAGSTSDPASVAKSRGPNRTIVVGDVHGCRTELVQLLDSIAFTTGDRLVFVGDLVARGPDSLGVLALVRETGAIVVRGNHEERVLRERAHDRDPSDGHTISRPHREIAASLRDEDWVLLETSPLFARFPDHAFTVVHAGLDPHVPFEEQTANTLLHVRNARDAAGQKHLWGALYAGPEPIVFGHNAVERLQLHAFATGLDTGCVYGGELTALVLGENERLPMSPEARRAHLVSVPATRVWFGPHAHY